MWIYQKITKVCQLYISNIIQCRKHLYQKRICRKIMTYHQTVNKTLQHLCAVHMWFRACIEGADINRL